VEHRVSKTTFHHNFKKNLFHISTNIAAFSPKYFATCNNIECFSKVIKMAQFYFSVMAHYANVERFILHAATNLKEREIFLIESVSILLKLVCYLKHLSCN